MHEAILNHLYAMDDVQRVPSCWPCILALAGCVLFWTLVGLLLWRAI